MSTYPISHCMYIIVFYSVFKSVFQIHNFNKKKIYGNLLLILKTRKKNGFVKLVAIIFSKIKYFFRLRKGQVSLHLIQSCFNTWLLTMLLGNNLMKCGNA